MNGIKMFKRTALVFMASLAMFSLAKAEQLATPQEVDEFQDIVTLSEFSPQSALDTLSEKLLLSNKDQTIIALHLLASEILLRNEQFELMRYHLTQLEKRVDRWVHTEAYINMQLLHAAYYIKNEKAIDALIIINSLLSLIESDGYSHYSSRTYFLLGDLMFSLSAYERAKNYLQLSESLLVRNNDRELLVDIYRRRAAIFLAQKNADQALSMINKAESVLPFSKLVIQIQMMIEHCFILISTAALDDANNLLTQLERVQAETDDAFIKLLVWRNLALLYYQLNAFDKAITNVKKYVAQFKQQEKNYYRGLELKGLILSKTENYALSKKYLQSAIDNLGPQYALRLDSIVTMAKLLEQQGQTQEAQTLLIQNMEMLSAKFRHSNRERVLKVHQLFQRQAKENNIALLNNANRLKELELKKSALEYQLVIVVVFVLILVIAFLVLWRSTISKRDQKLFALDQELQEMSVRDPLTMLYNRRYIKNTADTLIANCQRRFERAENDESYLGFIMLDIDHLNRLNEYYSHELGDHVLKQIAEDLKRDCREGDSVIRWGGEEFLILVNDTNFERLEKFCRRLINERNQREIHFQQTTHHVTCSLGYVLFPFDGKLNTQFNWEDTIKIADHCLRIAKSEGRNRAYGLEAISMSSEAKYLLFTDFDACIAQEYAKLHLIEGAVALSP